MVDARLEEAIIQTKARLVVLDPIQGFLGAGVDTVSYTHLMCIRDRYIRMQSSQRIRSFMEQ